MGFFVWTKQLIACILTMVKVRYPFHRAQRGLYAGKRVATGHKISFSDKKQALSFSTLIFQNESMVQAKHTKKDFT